MRCLLDTHIVIWAMVGSPKLSSLAHEILEDPQNVFYVSAASIWETAIKHVVKPVEIPVTVNQMMRFCLESGIIELPVRFVHARKVSELPLYHRDPFDRLLVAQAEMENLRLVTHDHLLPSYGDVVLSV